MPTYKQIQAKLDKEGTLALENTKNPSLRVVVHRFLIKQDRSLYPGSKKIHTAASKSRSRQDLYLTLKNYFPKTTYEQASKIFTGLVKADLIDSWACSTTHRVVSAPRNQLVTKEEVGTVIDELELGFKSEDRATPVIVKNNPGRKKKPVHEDLDEMEEKFNQEEEETYDEDDEDEDDD